MSAPAINKSMSAFDWTMLITLSVVWGGSFFFVGVIVNDLPPMTIVFFRVAIAAIALHIFMRLAGRKVPTSTANWISFFGMGLLNNVIPFGLIVWGQTHIASSVASILNATTPLFTVFVAHFLTQDEKLTPLRIGGVVVGFVGVAVMIGGSAVAEGLSSGFAQLAFIAAALSYAIASVYGRRFKQLEVDPYAVATGQVTASTIMMLPIMLIIDQPWTLDAPSTSSIAALIALGIISTAYAYILYFKILSSAGSTNASLVTFLVPVSAILLGITLLDEVMLPRHLVGLAFIIIGLMLVDGRLFKRRSS